MNRREMLSSLVALPMVAAVEVPTCARFYGFLDVEGHLAHKRLTGEDLHVWVDGVDVTSDCFEADDQEGFVHLFCRDGEGHAQWTAKGALHLRGGGVCRLRITGEVVIAPEGGVK
jgi:hypothetical protein